MLSQKSYTEIRMCKCRDVLIIESETATVETIQKFIDKIDDRGCDVALNAEQGLRLLSLKLQAGCCKNSYEIIFVSLDY